MTKDKEIRKIKVAQPPYSNSPKREFWEQPQSQIMTNKPIDKQPHVEGLEELRDLLGQALWEIDGWETKWSDIEEVLRENHRKCADKYIIPKLSAFIQQKVKEAREGTYSISTLVDIGNDAYRDGKKVADNILQEMKEYLNTLMQGSSSNNDYKNGYLDCLNAVRAKLESIKQEGRDE